MAGSTLRRAAVAAVAAAAAAGEGSVNMAMDPSQIQASTAGVPLYDCHAEYDMWQTAWSPDWKEWCCTNERRGCPSTIITTVTSSTRTSSSSTQTTTSRTTLARTTTTERATTTKTPPMPAPAFGCEVECKLKGVVAQCNERIAWSTTHETTHEKAPCLAAHVLVISQCPSCENCSAALAGCHDEDKAFLFKKKLQQKFAQSPPLAGQTSAGSFVALAGAASFAVLGSLVAAVAVVRIRRGSQEHSGAARGVWVAMEGQADDRIAASANE